VKRRVVAAAVALLTGAVFGGACDAGVIHTFGAFPYNAARNCLENAGVVDVIDGPDPGACPGARCWVAPSGNVFVSDQACDAPLDYAQSTSGPCELALDAYKARTMCANLGGVTDAGG
jgi:hypothetical protein